MVERAQEANYPNSIQMHETELKMHVPFESYYLADSASNSDLMFGSFSRVKEWSCVTWNILEASQGVLEVVKSRNAWVDLKLANDNLLAFLIPHKLSTNFGHSQTNFVAGYSIHFELH